MGECCDWFVYCIILLRIPACVSSATLIQHGVAASVVIIECTSFVVKVGTIGLCELG